MATHKNGLKVTVSSVSSTGGTGLGPFTVGAAATSTDAPYYAFGAGDNGKTFDIRVVEGANEEIATECLYTHSGTTLTRGTLEQSTTGSRIAFTSAAVITATLTAAKVNQLEPLTPAQSFGGASEVSITGAATATLNANHVCSGTSYTLTLPTAVGNAGAFIGVRITASGLVTLDGNSTETIDGALTRILWAGEVAVLRSNGTEWKKVSGKSIPMVAVMRRAAAQSFASATYAKCNLDTASIDNASIADPTTNFRINIKRAGIYLVSVYGRFSVPGPTFSVVAGCFQNGSEAFRADGYAASDPGCSGSTPLSLAASDYLELYLFQGAPGSQNTLTTLQPLLSATEILVW